MLPAGAGTTTTTTEIWHWQCGACRADWKMMRQVTTTSCPHGHGCRCCQGTPPPPGGNPPLPPPPPPPPPPHHHHHHHHRHRHAEGSSSRALAAADEGSNAVAGRDRNTTTAVKPAPHAVVAQVCWAPDPYLMAQQLRELESLNDEVVALRVQLQEYAEEIERSVARDKQGDGTNWFLALPANVRDVLVMARDAIDSLIAITGAAPAN